MVDMDIFSVLYTGADRAIAAELQRLADLVGVDFTCEPRTSIRISHAQEDDSASPIVSRQSMAVLYFNDAPTPGQVEAQFHEMFAPYFPRGKVRLHPREDSSEILELMAAVGATVRGRVVGVLGAHGGAGTSTIAAWLARIFAREESAGLIDLNPSSVGIDQLLAIETAPGKRWADLLGSGAVLAGRLNDVLPIWHAVRVVSADERGAVPNMEAGARVIAALSQVQPWTILDLPTYAGVPGTAEHSLVEWCDILVLLTKTDAVSLAHAACRITHISQQVLVVANGISGSFHSAHIAHSVGVEQVLSVRHIRGMAADIDHGVSPGDRSRAAMAKDIRKICQHIRDQISA
ncbi:hypothetical protein [Trueperella sp. LYQ143]|uniref:hypothetical protein n=1 Tax=unclassified Trueperella TaxID=2630174 RepID=UPI003982E6AA